MQLVAIRKLICVAMSVFKDSATLVRAIKSPDGKIRTEPFLDVCRHVIPIVGMFFSTTSSFPHTTSPPSTCLSHHPSPPPHFAEKLGTAFILVKSDVGGNIDRLSTRAALKPQYLDDIFSILTDEVASDSHTDSSSCTKGLLWLKRAMQFITELLNLLSSSSSSTSTPIAMSDAVTQSYASTLQPFHGWIVGSTFTVAFKLAPARDTFFEKLGVVDEQGSEGMIHMAQFCEEYGAILKDIHEYMDAHGLNDPAKV